MDSESEFDSGSEASITGDENPAKNKVCWNVGKNTLEGLCCIL